jgi:hypothetical protein
MVASLGLTEPNLIGDTKGAANGAAVVVAPRSTYTEESRLGAALPMV